MKRIFTLLIFLSSLSLAQAQILIDSAANWQQHIPNLLGGECVQISNVSVTGDLGAFGLFQDTSGLLGITQGIVMTSGRARIAAGPNDQSGAGLGLYTPGDADLQALLNGMTLTYDAAAIEFDFTSPILDTVSVDYVFGSEEYLEFVGSNFNDVFAFFVSGPGINGLENIALVPGTQMPVAINSINQDTNSIYYVNNLDQGQGGITQLNQYLQYDGLTVPLTATFVAQAGVTYHLKMVISDASDGILDSGVFLGMHTTNQALNGAVTFQGAAATAGTVELFGYNVDPGLAPLVATTTIDVNGAYDFQNIPAGAYNIRITLDTLAYPGTFPVYYDSAVFWNDATIVSLPCNNGPLNVQARELPFNNGQGALAGVFQIDNPLQQQRFPLSPAAGIAVYLVNDADNSIQAFAYTDVLGMYRFQNIPNGNYHILPDVPGLPVVSFHNIQIDNQAYQFAGLDYVMDETSIYSVLATGIQQPTEGLVVYPNPVHGGTLMVQNIGLDAQVSLFDMQGRQVFSAIGNGNINVPVGNLSNGVYTLSVKNGEGVRTQRVVVD